MSKPNDIPAKSDAQLMLVTIPLIIKFYQELLKYHQAEETNNDAQEKELWMVFKKSAEAAYANAMKVANTPYWKTKPGSPAHEVLTLFNTEQINGKTTIDNIMDDEIDELKTMRTIFEFEQIKEQVDLSVSRCHQLAQILSQV